MKIEIEKKRKYEYLELKRREVEPVTEPHSQKRILDFAGVKGGAFLAPLDSLALVEMTEAG